MKIDIYQVDAFTDKLFGGNPAAICPLEEWLDDEILQRIAIENNLAETAFFIPKDDHYHLRWFTPEIEMDLCGHATLASSHVIFNHLDYNKNEIRFDSMSGELRVVQVEDKLQMDFPAWGLEDSELPGTIANSLSIQPKKVLKSRDYFLVFENEDEIRGLAVDQNLIKDINLGHGGIICTAKGNEVDFVSRFFTPGAAVFEDPVTGSAHCSLTPYWAITLGKNQLIAHQISERLGILYCEFEGDRVKISGNAVTYLKGEIYI